MKEVYKSGSITSEKASRTEYLLWCPKRGQIGCMPSDGRCVHLFDSEDLDVEDLVLVASIMLQMRADFAKKRKKKGDNR